MDIPKLQDRRAELVAAYGQVNNTSQVIAGQINEIDFWIDKLNTELLDKKDPPLVE